MRRLNVVSLGLVPYGEALELQRQVAQRVIGGSVDGDVLLLLEHPPVVTLGRSTKQGNLVASPAFLASRGVELFDVERGGDVTFHGPGQLVGYPIVDLKALPHKRDLHWYLRQVEESLIRALGVLGIEGARQPGYTGVWVGSDSASDGSITSGTDDESGRRVEGVEGAPGTARARQRKIASIGVHARDWVTWHGFAINVMTDLSFFDLIVPCGIAGVQMTTIAAELGRTRSAVSVDSFAKLVVTAWADVFGVSAELTALQDIVPVLPAISSSVAG